MAVPSCAIACRPFECRSGPDFSGRLPRPEFPTFGAARFSAKANSVTQGFSAGSLFYSLISRFPLNFGRQRSTKARRNCSNIGIAQIVAASWSDNQQGVPLLPL
ncbi:unnamed protein product [Coffea canephora]|uniref:DH200=94 genomic scaffold, scaffold_5583 n=1 Tax=Coffea canephora TaxID=49390 RepID=A0A068VPN3_COFCA|nr:unnamed protein product [Coffea canephora]